MENENIKFDLTNDYLFKRTFGYKGQEHITKIFLRDLFLEKIKEITLDNNTITEKDIMTDKMGIMDIKAVIDENVQCDIEMQVVQQNDIDKRILFYMSNEFKKTVTSGKRYSDMKKTIAVLITDFRIKSIEKVPKYASKWNFREENYPEVILTDAMEIYIIELPKLTQYANNTNRERLNLWAKFIKNPGVKIMIDENDDEEMRETKETIQEAQERYNDVLQDKHEQDLAELRLKYILDQNSIRSSGYDDGKEEGKKEGMKEGIEKKTKEVIINMLNKGMDDRVIIEVTNVSKEKLDEIKNNNG